MQHMFEHHSVHIHNSKLCTVIAEFLTISCIFSAATFKNVLIACNVCMHVHVHHKSVRVKDA